MTPGLSELISHEDQARLAAIHRDLVGFAVDSLPARVLLPLQKMTPGMETLRWRARGTPKAKQISEVCEAMITVEL